MSASAISARAGPGGATSQSITFSGGAIFASAISVRAGPGSATLQSGTLAVPFLPVPFLAVPLCRAAHMRRHDVTSQILKVKTADVCTFFG